MYAVFFGEPCCDVRLVFVDSFNQHRGYPDIQGSVTITGKDINIVLFHFRLDPRCRMAIASGSGMTAGVTLRMTVRGNAIDDKNKVRDGGGDLLNFAQKFGDR